MTISERTRCLALVLITFVAYVPVWRAGYVWDDEAHVTENATLRSFGGLAKIWTDPQASPQYYPLELTTHWIEYHLWGSRPLGYHLVNVFLHALNAVLLWQVLRKLDVSGAWFAAAIFAVHPIEVESVAWISERKNVLSAVFYLAAMLAYLRERPKGLVLLLFLCAMFSKTVTCTLPVVLLVLIGWKRGRVEWRDAKTLAPLFVFGVAFGLATVWLERHHVGALGLDWSMSWLERCLVAGRAWWFYVAKLIWPAQLTFIYSRWPVDAGVWWQYLFPIGVVGALTAFWIFRRAPFVAAMVYTITLFPALGFIDVFPFRYSFVADHFQYLAGTALIAVIASKLNGRIAAILIVALGILTWRQAYLYKDSETLWRDTLAKNPDCWMAHNNYGWELCQSNRVAEGISHFEQALRTKPDFASAQNNWGNALTMTGQLEEAIRHYELALRIYPGYAEALLNLGRALRHTGRVPEAITQYRNALRLRPDYAEAHYNLGNAFLQLGEIDNAIRQYEEALRIRPDFAEAKRNLDVAYASRSR